MLVSKSFVIVGTTSIRDGKYVKDIGQKVDEAINGFLKTTPGKYVDIKPSVTIHSGIGEDYAFVTVIIDVDVPEEDTEQKRGGFFSKKK